MRLRPTPGGRGDTTNLATADDQLGQSQADPTRANHDCGKRRRTLSDHLDPIPAETNQRRDFLRAVGLTTVGGALLAGCSFGEGDANNQVGETGAAGEAGESTSTVADAGSTADAGSGESAGAAAGPELVWEMASSWSPGLPTLWASNNFFASRVQELTGGAFTINVREAGDLSAPLEVLGAIRDRRAPIGTTASYYYLEESPVTAFGTALPFGLTTRQQYSWLYAGGGLELIQAFYAENFNVIQFPVASTGAQMGGWFNREINVAADLRGLKMRIPGLGGRVMAELGVETESMSAGELAAALDSGAIDAAEFIGPEDDKNLGLQERARFYYYPGFWEPSATLEVQIDLDEWQALPDTYRHAIRSAASETLLWTMALYDARNGQALNDLVAAGTELREFPLEVLEAARAASGLLLDEIAATDSDFARVLEHWRSFRRQVTPWFNLAEASLLR